MLHLIQLGNEEGETAINTGAYIQWNLLEKSSYTSAISVNVTSSSSIPNENSSIF